MGKRDREGETAEEAEARRLRKQEKKAKKHKKNEEIQAEEEEVDEVEINPIVAKQIKALKNSMKTYGLKPDHILKGLNNNE